MQEEMSEKLAKERAEDVNQNKISIPSKILEDFREVNENNQKDFEYVAYQVIIQFMEKFSDKALEFPPCIGSIGRSIIHDIANCLQLAHHSEGGKKNRRIFVYPKTMFKEKQEKEKRRLEKEREKLRSQFKDY